MPIETIEDLARARANRWHMSGLDEDQLVKLENDFLEALREGARRQDYCSICGRTLDEYIPPETL